MPRLTREQIAQAKEVDLLALAGADTELRRIAAHEYAGPCPFCGGTDRFHVQPDSGRWFCRQCTGEPNQTGWRDAIDYIRRRQQVGFTDAVACLSRPARLPPPSRRRSTGVVPGHRLAWKLPAWQLAADSDLEQAQATLASAEGEVGRSYLAGRGLCPATWQAWGLGLARLWHPQRHDHFPALLLPWWMGRRLRAVQHRYIAPGLDRHERYGQRAGGQRLLFGLQLLAKRPTLFLVEGELNALSLWQVGHDQADVLSWGPQGNLMRPQVLALASLLARRYRRLVVWADELDLARLGLGALKAFASLPAGACAIGSPEGRDANDLLQAGELAAFLQTHLPSGG